MIKAIIYSVFFIMINQTCFAANHNQPSDYQPETNGNKTHKMVYEILTKGKPIGHLTHRVMPVGQGYAIAESSEIKLSGWWGKINIHSTFIDTYNSKGELLTSDNKVRDGSTTHELTTLHEKDGYFASYQKIKKTTKGELIKLNTLSELINRDTYINPETMLSLFQTAFTNRRTQNQEKGSFSKNSFDTTFTYLSFFLQKHTQDGFNKEVTLYDTEELKLSTHTVKDLGWETLELKGKPIKTRHFSLNDKKNPETHIWLSDFSMLKHKQTSGEAPSSIFPRTIPYLVRMTAEDKEGPIEITLKEKMVISYNQSIH